MGAKLEIEIVDSGASPVGAPPPPGAGTFTTPPAQATPAPSSSPNDSAGPERTAPDKSPASELTSVSEGVRVLAKALGYDGILGVTQLLHRAFTELSQAVKKATEVEADRARTTTSTPAPSGAGRNDATDAIDVEFTDALGRTHRPPGTELAVRNQLPATVEAPAGAGAGQATADAKGAAGLASAVGPAVLAVGALAVGVGIATAAISKFVDSMKAEAEKLANYSPELAGATANSEIREMMGEMRRAQENGPQLAKFEDARSRISQQLYDLGTRVEGWLLSVATPILQLLANVGPVVSSHMEVLVASVKVLIDQVLEFLKIGGIFIDEQVDLAKAMDKLAKVLRDAANPDDDPVNDPFMDQLMGMDNGAGQLFGPQIPRARAAAGV